MKVGIVGCGAIALNKHIPAILKSSGVSVAALCAHSPSSAAEALSRCGGSGVYCCSDYRDILSDEKIDAVCICLPNRMHSSVTVEALQSGKHVLCEKPMACSAQEAQAMYDAALKYARTLSIGFQNRWTDDAVYLKKLVKQGELGSIYHIDAVYMRRRALPTWGEFTSDGSGGALLDIGSHIIDLALYIAGDFSPESVMGKTYSRLMRRGSDCNRWGRWNVESTCEDSAFAMVRMTSGITVNVSVSWAANIGDEETMSLRFLGDHGGAELTKNGVCIIREHCGRLESTEALRSASISGKYTPETVLETPADREWKEFISQVRMGAAGNCEQALCVSRIIQGIYDSSEQNKEIIFPFKAL